MPVKIVPVILKLVSYFIIENKIKLITLFTGMKIMIDLSVLE